MNSWISLHVHEFNQIAYMHLRCMRCSLRPRALKADHLLLTFFATAR